MNKLFCFAVVVVALIAAFIAVIVEASSSSHFKIFKEEASSSSSASSKFKNPTTIIQVACDINGDHMELTNARDHIRKNLQPLKSDVVVNVSGICFPPAFNVSVLELTGSKDSGTNGYTITYQGDKSQYYISSMTGGHQLPFHLWSPAKKSHGVPAQVMVANLSLALGFPVSQITGRFAASGLGCSRSDRAELFIDETPMTLARTPNNANASTTPWMNWMNIDEVDSDSSFSSKSADMKNAVGTATPDTDVYALGYWSFDWAMSYIKVNSITTGPYGYKIEQDKTTPPVYGYKKTARFMLLNSIKFLDSPGEYFIDAASGLIYLYPPANFNVGSNIWISVNHAPLISQKNPQDSVLANVTISGFSLNYGRTSAIELKNAENVEINYNKISNFGRTCMSLHGSNIVAGNNMVQFCGCSGISISGGDAKTLKSSGNQLNTNTIQYFSRISRVYTPGISYSGVGHQLTSNQLRWGPSQAIQGGGNNIIVASNTIHNTNYGCRDCGAFYTGRSWTKRGTVLTNNLFSQIRIVEPTFLGSPLITCIYWDDQQSGMTASGNTFTNVMSGILLGGGRDNTVTDNHFNTIDTHACHMDDRGMSWQKSYCTPPNGELVKQLFSVNYTHPPYSNYPGMSTTLSDRPCVPVGNTIVNNICSDAKEGFIDQSDATIKSWGSTINGNQGCKKN